MTTTMATVAQTVRVFIETHYRYHHTLSCRGRKHLHSPFARRLACTWHHQQPSVLCRRDEKIFFDRETGKLVARLSSEWNGGEARSLQGRSYQLYLHDNVLSETDMTAVHRLSSSCLRQEFTNSRGASKSSRPPLRSYPPLEGTVRRPIRSARRSLFSVSPIRPSRFSLGNLSGQLGQILARPVCP